MPIDQAVWRLGEKPERLAEASLDSEEELERLIASDISVLNDRWLLIGRQVLTDHGSKIDLLAIDADGTLIVIELKRNQTPRDVVAQAIDYASWVEDLDGRRVAAVFADYVARFRSELAGTTLDQAFKKRFECDLTDINDGHQVVVVAASLDASTERIVRYLSNRQIGINVLFFRVLADGAVRYVSRAWLLDPADAVDSAPREPATPWNGDSYVSFGHSERGRRWEDALRYGFVSAGGGRWYSRTMSLLEPDQRVFVNVPGAGYVGVGIVEAPAVPGSEFMVADDSGVNAPITRAKQLKGNYGFDGDEDKAELFARVRWIKTVGLDRAIKEVGLFGNQNSVCRPITPKWIHTVKRVSELLGVK